jgi:hypothetical protein
MHIFFWRWFSWPDVRSLFPQQRVGDAYEVEVHDDGTTAMLNSSILHHDWDEAAKKVCPRGYAIVRQEYYKEEPFNPARIVGTITCQ